MQRRRLQQTVCDSLLVSVAVVAALTLSLVYYRHDLRQLLRMLFLVSILFGALLAFRHSLGRARRRLRKWWSRGKEDRETVVEERPDLDRARDEAFARAQRLHDQKAEDFESRVAGPRRNKRLEEAQRKSSYLRGFGRDQGRIVGVASGSGDSATGAGDQAAGSCESHVTEDDVISEGDESGRRVCVAVQLALMTVRSQFHISQTMKVVYDWLEREGHASQGHVLIMPHSRQLLDNRGRTLEDYGIVMDTKLILEELDD